MWWPFRRKKKRRWLLVVHDDLVDQFKAGEYEARCLRYFEPETGFTLICCHDPAVRLFPNEPFILESVVTQIRVRKGLEPDPTSQETELFEEFEPEQSAE